MDSLTLAKISIITIVAFLASLALGDYLGYKIGRWRLATLVGITALIAIVAFAVYVIVFA